MTGMTTSSEEDGQATPQVEDVNCACGGIMVPNPDDIWVCVECERTAVLSWRWTDDE